MGLLDMFRRSASAPAATGNRTNSNNTNESEHHSDPKTPSPGSAPSSPANTCAGGNSTQSQISLRWCPSWPFDLTSIKQTYIQKKGAVFTLNKSSTSSSENNER